MTSTQLQLCDTTDMVVVHRVFRREFRLLPPMVTAVRNGDTRRAAEIAAHAEEITDALHEHHHNEDVLLWPKIAQRADLDRVIVQRMHGQHERIAELLAEMQLLLPQWRGSADAELGATLTVALAAVSAALDEHLADEETHLLPLAERHISADEWAELGDSAIANMSKGRLLVFVGDILEDASPAEQASMLAKLPRPARIAVRLIGRPRARMRARSLRRDLRQDPEA